MLKRQQVKANPPADPDIVPDEVQTMPKLPQRKVTPPADPVELRWDGGTVTLQPPDDVYNRQRAIEIDAAFSAAHDVPAGVYAHCDGDEGTWIYRLAPP